MAFGLNIVILLVLLIGGVLLQIFLSRRESRWPGLILPGVTFLISLVALLGVALFTGMSTLDAVFLHFMVFFLYNIPTLVLLGIYLACREKHRRREQMEKMNIQDLE